jgi:hypothetical protein
VVPPTNWAAFRQQQRHEVDELRRYAAHSGGIMPQLLAAKLPHGLARSFVTAPTSLLHLWIASDAATAREHAVYAGAPMERLVAELHEPMRFAPQSWVHALSYRSMLRGLGMLTAPEQALEIERAMLDAAEASMHDLPPSWRATGAWMCIALGVPERLPRWDDGAALKPRTTLGELPRRQMLHLARRYAEVRLGGGDLGSTKPTWDWVLGVFLDEIEGQTAEWDALWWAGKLWLQDVEGESDRDLGSAFSRWIEGLE